MRFTRRLRGGSNWDNVPPERLPSPTFWNKCIPGTPFAKVQTELHAKGLHQPWLRATYWRYDNAMRHSWPLATIFNANSVRLGFVIAMGMVFLEEVFGFQNGGEKFFTVDGKEMNPGHMDMAQANTGYPEVEGDEHVKFYRGSHNIFNQRYAFETSQTKGQ